MTKDKKKLALEGQVQRGIDFNLKKEDLMLLILEGKKRSNGRNHFKASARIRKSS